MSLKMLFSKRLYFSYVIIIVISILSILKLHGASIGIYNIFFYGNSYKDPNLIFGQPRPVRGDDWNVYIPFIVSQSVENFSLINKNIGLGQIVGSMNDIPIWHWKEIFHSQSFPFFLLPLEYAFSFRWWLKGALLIMSVYLLTSFLTKQYIFALLMSVIFFFSPFFHWWYGTDYLEITSYVILTIYFSLKAFNYKTQRDLILNTAAFIYLVLSIALMIYPPVQISMALLVLFFLAGYIANNIKFINKPRLKMYSIAGCIAVSIISIVLVAYYFEFKDIIQILQNTSYPGKREVVGGGFPWQRFLFGFYNIELLNETKPIPPILDNQSEASSFFMLFPFVLPITFYYMIKNYLKKRKVDFIPLSLSLYLILSSIWILIGLPKVIAKVLLLNLVPANRMIIGIGVANLLLIIYFLSNLKIRKSFNYKVVAYVLAGIGFILHFILGYNLQLRYPFYAINDLIIFLVSIVAFFSILFLLLQKQKLFIILLLIYSLLSSYKVNPLYRGLSPMINSELARQIQKIEKNNIKKERWVVYNNLALGNYLVANGANSINSVHLYPQLNLWKKFDPDKKYYSVYNRYAHVIVAENVPNKIEFKLLRDDFFAIGVHPCHEILKELNVKYFVFTKKVNYSCLSEIEKIDYPALSLYIYKRSYN